MQDVVSRVASETLTESYKTFIDEAFIEVLVHKGKNPSQTQARAAITGSTFELCIEEILHRDFPHIPYTKNVAFPDAGISSGSGADFVFYETQDKNNITAIIEAKGSADKLVWPDGTVQEPSRPGLRRSDTMKKAISQAYQVDRGISSDIPFYLFTTHKPKTGVTKTIYELAIGDIITDTVNVTQKEEVSETLSKLYP